MTVLELPRATPGAHRTQTTAGLHRVRGVFLFVCLAACYCAVGFVLLMRYNLFDPDALSRVANAGYVLYSRDPHLSAIGFVWNPLPSLIEVPILQLARWWPELRTHGLAGVVQSALFMAGAVVMVDRIGRDRGLAPRWRRLAVVAFACQPMIVVYGASGMSEAAELFGVLWCVRHLMRWADTRRPNDLACAGLALALGYLARYEVVPAALGAALFVGLVTIAGAGRARGPTAVANVAIIIFPVTVAAAVWALSGWVVNQELFATLSSRYGNDSIVAAAMRRSGPMVPAGSGDWLGIAARTFGMQPFAGIVCGAAAVHAAFTRNAVALVPVAVLGPILAFAAWGQFTATTFGCFRYYLPAIPLVICVAIALWRPPEARTLGALLVCASILIGYPVTAVASLNQRIGNQPLQYGFNSLLFPSRFTPEEPENIWYRRLLVDDRVLAGDLDRRRLPDGSVLMDTFNTWGVWMSSTRPTQFVITSDFDFTAALNRPWAQGVQYLLVSNPAVSDADALNVRYPTLWHDGAGFSRLMYAVAGAGGEERFRLYRVTGPPRRAAATTAQR